MIPSKENLKKIVNEIKKILRLLDWDIEVEILSNDEYTKLNGNEDQAHNKISRFHDYSYITINKDICEDWYQSLLHEMFHLVFDHLETADTLIVNLASNNTKNAIEDLFRVALERTVERCANIFVSLYPIDKIIKEV